MENDEYAPYTVGTRVASAICQIGTYFNTETFKRFAANSPGTAATAV